MKFLFKTVSVVFSCSLISVNASMIVTDFSDLDTEAPGVVFPSITEEESPVSPEALNREIDGVSIHDIKGLNATHQDMRIFLDGRRLRCSPRRKSL